MLGSVYFNSTKLWVDILQDSLTNNLAGHYYSIDLSHGGNAFVLNSALVTSGAITSSDQATINAAVSALTTYKTVLPFDGTFPPEPS
jgi:hypothetical protein